MYNRNQNQLFLHSHLSTRTYTQLSEAQQMYKVNLGPLLVFHARKKGASVVSYRK